MDFLRKYSVQSLVILGIALRLAYAFWMQEVLLGGDAEYYVKHAEDILSGKSFTPEWPPGLSYWLAGVEFLFGSNLFAYVLAMLVVYLLFSLFLYKSLCLFFAKKWCLIGVAFFTLSPTFIHHSVAPLTQLPIALCLVAIFYFLMKDGQGWKIGLFLAISILTRAGCLALLPVVLAYLFYQKRYKALPGFLAVLLILIGSWQYKSYQMTDRWVWINDFNSYNLFVGNNTYTPDYKTWWLGSHAERESPEFKGYYEIVDSVKSLPKAEQSEAYSSLSWGYIYDNPGIFVHRSWNRLRTFFAFDSYTGATIYAKNKAIGIVVLLLDASMFILLGLCFLLGLGKLKPPFLPRIQLLLLCLILSYMLPYLLAFSHPTYHLPTTPLMVFFAIKALHSYKKRSLWKTSPLYIRLLVIFFLFIQIEWVWQMADRLG